MVVVVDRIEATYCKELEELNTVFFGQHFGAVLQLKQGQEDHYKIEDLGLEHAHSRQAIASIVVDSKDRVFASTRSHISYKSPEDSVWTTHNLEERLKAPLPGKQL